MLRRFLYTPAGRIRLRRMLLVLAVTLALAIYGSFLLALTPSLTDHEGVRTVWVLFCIFLLKFPLIALLWWFIIRNKEWPVRAPRWSVEEIREILRYIVAEAERSRSLPDASARLGYLRREAWNVADRAPAEVKVDAVDVALHVDQLLTARPRGRRA